MTIQPLNNRTNSPVLPSKSTENGTVKTAESTTVDRSKDKLAMTPAAKEMTKGVKSSPTVNQEKVSKIQAALENGSYQIKADQIASKMLQRESDQFNSR